MSSTYRYDLPTGPAESLTYPGRSPRTQQAHKPGSAPDLTVLRPTLHSLSLRQAALLSCSFLDRKALLGILGSPTVSPRDPAKPCPDSLGHLAFLALEPRPKAERMAWRGQRDGAEPGAGDFGLGSLPDYQCMDL